MGHYPSPQIHKGLCTLARTSFILPGRHYPPTGYEGIISAEPEGSAPPDAAKVQNLFEFAKGKRIITHDSAHSQLEIN